MNSQIMFASILLTITTTATCGFFFLIGKRQRGAIPILFLLFFVSNAIEVKQQETQSLKEIMQKYGLIISWLIIMFGLRGIGTYLKIDIYQTIGIITSINIILIAISLYQEYSDGIRVFQIAYRLCLLSIIILGFSENTTTGRIIIRGLIAMSMAIYGFFYFIIGKINQKSSNSIKETLIIATHTTLLATLMSIPENIFYGLFYAQLYLGIVYTSLHLFKKQKQQTTIEKRITASDILAGAKVTQQKKKNKLTRTHDFWELIQDTSSHTKATLSILNIVVMLAIMASFFTNIGKTSNIIWITESLYRVSIIIFIYNFITIKKIDLYYNIQRIFVFFIINFAIYLSLLNIFNTQVQNITMRAIVRNLLNSGIIFYSDELLEKNILKYKDYYYRVGANLLAMIVNVILLQKIANLPGQLNFAITTLYIGIQGFLMYYNLNFIKKKEQEHLLLEQTKRIFSK